jgi:M6 family metalloprotease-like protein
MVERVIGPDGWFAHIGTHAHEFGHLIGFADEYCIQDCSNAGGTSTVEFDLMAFGFANGPNLGSCPAFPNPYYRINCGWVTPTLLDRDATNLTVGYNYEDPIYYRINPVNRNTRFPHDEHFLFETRLHRGTFDLYTPTAPQDSNFQSGTLLVWRTNPELIE